MVLATLGSAQGWQLATLASGLVLVCLVARLPLLPLLRRACVVLLFFGALAVLSLLAGRWQQALLNVARGYCSAFAVLLLTFSTPLPQLLHGAERLGAPSMVTLVIQLMYRYIAVATDQAERMWRAAQARGAFGKMSLRMRLHTSAGMVAALFQFSMQRAERLHRMLLARGFQGAWPVQPLRWTGADSALLIGTLLLCLASLTLR